MALKKSWTIITGWLLSHPPCPLLGFLHYFWFEGNFWIFLHFSIFLMFLLVFLLWFSLDYCIFKYCIQNTWFLILWCNQWLIITVLSFIFLQLSSNASGLDDSIAPEITNMRAFFWWRVLKNIFWYIFLDLAISGHTESHKSMEISFERKNHIRIHK